MCEVYSEGWNCDEDFATSGSCTLSLCLQVAEDGDCIYALCTHLLSIYTVHIHVLTVRWLCYSKMGICILTRVDCDVCSCAMYHTRMFTDEPCICS